MARALGLLAVTSVYAFTHDESAACYASRYPDLHARFCATDRCDTQALHDHYKNEGATEGRRWGCGSRFDAVSDLTARVPCRFVGGERHCDESKAVPCSHRQAYVVADHGIRTGGPVALRQLAKSFNDAFPGQGFMSEIKHPRPEGIAGAFDPRKLCPGDIYIVPEVRPCNGQPPNGVRMYVWQLGSKPRKRCPYLHHNHWLAHHQGHDLPRERIITPYIAPHVVPTGVVSSQGADKVPAQVTQAVKLVGLNAYDGEISEVTTPKRGKLGNVVLIDDDVPRNVVTSISATARKVNMTARVVKGIPQMELPEVYQSAMVVIDWCMRGSERMPLEAALHGVLFFTNACQSGADFSDYPLPSYAVHRSGSIEAWLEPALKLAQADYWTLMSDFAPLRERILTHNREAMKIEARDFVDFETKRTMRIDEPDAAATFYVPLAALRSDEHPSHLPPVWNSTGNRPDQRRKL